jgi:mono/diheme cytochrome c family protein
MNIEVKTLFPLLIFYMACLPALLNAQNNHAVKKSPYQLSLDSGKKVYSVQCLTCHQADGLGVQNMNPPLTGKAISGDKKKLIDIVIKGLATHEEIDGETYQNVMPAHPEMKDQTIADVLTYIRNSFGNKASPVKLSEVKSARISLK